MGPMPGQMGGGVEPPSQGLGAAASFGASVTAKISIDASLAGAIILVKIASGTSMKNRSMGGSGGTVQKTTLR
ncbi:hypothetical protein COLO4_10403 [Corchorus olitorius]|uniref:Uncharacterized protein n=1 Tax=Corchorus olitorius TaxID=93759 RepID=A0A1R3K8U5_9ROSI|nr:hypothetical protein COLO4_10403 [Corchorus olitorius]